MKKLANEFTTFLREFKVVTVAVGFIIGTAASTLIQSFVNDVLLPAIEPFFFEGKWQDAVLQVGPSSIHWGIFLSASLNFFIIALAVFIIAKKILKWEAPK